MRLNAFVNEMAPYRPFVAFIKGCITFHSGGKMEVGPQEGMAKPQGMKVFAVERDGLPKDFVYFRTLCGVRSCVRVWSATGAGTGSGSMFQVCVLLS